MNTEPPEPLDTSGLASDVLTKIAEGEYRVAGPGQRDGKPVVVAAATGRWVEGSGRPAGANDPAEVGRQHGFKHSRVYQETLERLVPAMKSEGEYAVTSLEELLIAARRITTETTQRIEVEHKCSECEHVDLVEIVTEGRPDPKVLTFLIERLVGAANKTQDVTMRSEELLRVIEDKRVIHQIEVVTLTPAEMAERKRQIKEAS